jgi:UDP-glucose 4-epimerase
MSERLKRHENILVTGGAGFIGSSVVDQLTAKGHNVIVIDNLSLGKESNLTESMETGSVHLYIEDALNTEYLAQICGDHEVTCLWNMAVRPLPDSLENPIAAAEENTQLTLHALGVAREKGMLFVHFSSSEVYGDPIYTPQDENHPLGGHTVYAADKAASDLYVQSFGKTYGLESITVRPFNTIGPRQNEGRFSGLVPTVLKTIAEGGIPHYTGDGSQTRDFTYVVDIATIAYALANNAPMMDTYNVGSGQEMSVKEVIQHLAQFSNYQGLIEAHPARQGDVHRLLSDSTKARKYHPGIEYTQLFKALQMTTDWYLKAR